MKHILGSNTKSKLYRNGTPAVIDENCIQPNAIDLQLSEISRIERGVIALVGKRKDHLPTTKLIPQDGLYHLTPGRYDVLFDVDVEIASGEAAYLLHRSTLSRNGIVITSGLYDSGFTGQVGGVLHVPTGAELIIGEHERLAQFILVAAETSHLYDGVYNAKIQ